MPRGDGRLSHQLDPHQPGPQDECGVFGVWARGEEVAQAHLLGLYALQHRGQGRRPASRSAMAAAWWWYKDLGLVAQVFDEPTLARLARAHRGRAPLLRPPVGRRGRTPGRRCAATPTGPDGRGAATTIALAHNGNLVNTAELARWVADLGLVGCDGVRRPD